MDRFVPSDDAGIAERALSTLIAPTIKPDGFTRGIRSLHDLYSRCCANCCPPCADQRLVVTGEIQYQSELWLPLEVIRPHFFRFYSQALLFPPELASTPFVHAPSWAAIVAEFPPFLSPFVNPAELLETLVHDVVLRRKFLFWSFMPERYYGNGVDRYPQQTAAVAGWMRQREVGPEGLRCLDAACGDGVTSYGLARELLEQGWPPDRFQIEGWSRDRLEVWTAAFGIFPHSPGHEAAFRTVTEPVHRRNAARSLQFRVMDLNAESREKGFDLIVCNGLLGGPIVNRREDMERIVSNLCRLLLPGGVLLVADRFHGGWKKQIPGEILRDLLKAHGLSVSEFGEGLVGSAGS